MLRRRVCSSLKWNAAPPARNYASWCVSALLLDSSRAGNCRGAAAAPTSLVPRSVLSPTIRRFRGGATCAWSGAALPAVRCASSSPVSAAAPVISLDTSVADILSARDDTPDGGDGGEARSGVTGAWPLSRVVQLLLDAEAEGVETGVTLADFSAMQPKRQLAALGGRRAWLEWLIASPHYKQALRLAPQSAAQDVAALQRAGVRTLQQWIDQSHLVPISDQSRGALTAAAEESVRARMAEVARVVNDSHRHAELLAHWVSDVVGQFVLDSLRVSLATASTAMWKERRGNMPGDAGRGGGAAGPGDGEDNTDNLAAQLMMLDDLHHPAGADSKGDKGAGAAAGKAGGDPTLRAGEACTLEHYSAFLAKVVSSVRADRSSVGALGEVPTEAEVYQRAHTVVSTALEQLLTRAARRGLPSELRELADGGYLALDRVPGLLRRAVALLQLRSLPVRYFVLHSTVDGSLNVPGSASPEEALYLSALNVRRGGGHAETHPRDWRATTFPQGAFLCGADKLDVTLAEWSGKPVPPSAVAAEDTTQQDYFAILHRMKRHLGELSLTSLYEVVEGAEDYGASGSNDAATLVGLGQLFGPGKMVEDRLCSILHYPPSSVDRPIHYVEAGPAGGKTAVLRRLARRLRRPGEETVMVRYRSAATPFVPDLDDHPLAFPARFWFRVALSSCPFLVRVEDLYTRAPQSVAWWGHERNWSWEAFQQVIGAAHHLGGHHHHRRGSSSADGSVGGAGVGSRRQLCAIFVDDVDAVLDAMHAKWGAAALGAAAAEAGGVPLLMLDSAEDSTGNADGSSDGSDVASPPASAASSSPAVTAERRAAALAAARGEEQRRVVAAEWRASTGKPFEEVLSDAFAKITTALGQVHLVWAGQSVSPFLHAHCAAPCRRHHIPLVPSTGLQQRLRVLPLLATLHAYHMQYKMRFPGGLYEVLKNCPALTGKTIELFASGRLHFTGAMSEYAPRELYAELPLQNTLLQNPRQTRARLIELLQRQLCSPTGFLSTGIDTDARDVHSGLTLPYSHTLSQVHPFALYTIFTYSHESSLAGGGGGAERRVVRAWAEVWAAYHAAVKTLSTTAERRRQALNVLLHGALWLRAAATSSSSTTLLDVYGEAPLYGFPLVLPAQEGDGAGAAAAASTKALTDRAKKAVHAYKQFFANSPDMVVFRPLHSIGGQNRGCDVVMLHNHQLSLYNVITTREEQGTAVQRFAEALLGLLHLLEQQTFPAERAVHTLSYFSVVSIDQPHVSGGPATAAPVLPRQHARPGDSGVPVSGVGLELYSSLSAAAPAVPYYLDFAAVLSDAVMDHLQELQEALPLADRRDFRTLQDLVDELRKHGVVVRHEVLVAHEELEALLTPTLLQLVPDATVLPPYRTSVVSAEHLMMEAMLDPSAGDEPEDPYDAEQQEVRSDASIAADADMPPEVKEELLGVNDVLESADMLAAMIMDGDDWNSPVLSGAGGDAAATGTAAAAGGNANARAKADSSQPTGKGSPSSPAAAAPASHPTFTANELMAQLTGAGVEDPNAATHGDAAGHGGSADGTSASADYTGGAPGAKTDGGADGDDDDSGVDDALAWLHDILPSAAEAGGAGVPAAAGRGGAPGNAAGAGAAVAAGGAIGGGGGGAAGSAPPAVGASSSSSRVFSEEDAVFPLTFSRRTRQSAGADSGSPGGTDSGTSSSAGGARASRGGGRDDSKNDDDAGSRNYAVDELRAILDGKTVARRPARRAGRGASSSTSDTGSSGGSRGGRGGAGKGAGRGRRAAASAGKQSGRGGKGAKDSAPKRGRPPRASSTPAASRKKANAATGKTRGRKKK